jgi:hypothetical protein
MFGIVIFLASRALGFAHEYAEDAYLERGMELPRPKEEGFQE